MPSGQPFGAGAGVCTGADAFRDGTTIEPGSADAGLSTAGALIRKTSAPPRFVSPFADTVDPSGNGTFTYTTTFSLGPEVDLAHVQLVVRYGSDNEMTNIVLNGQSIGVVAAGTYSAFETVTLTTAFV